MSQPVAQQPVFQQADALAALRALIRRHCPEIRVKTAIPRVSLVHTDTPDVRVGVYHPMLCIVAQGAKKAHVGKAIVEYREAEYLVVSVDLPLTGSVTRASPEAPYLAFVLALDPAVLSDMLQVLPGKTPDQTLPGLAVSTAPAELLDAAVRLLRLLDTPDDISMLAPLAEREILYRLLTGPQAPMLRQIALSQGRTAQVSRAIGWIRAHFSEPLRIDAIARQANMSVSTLHSHFKAVTAMSPLQYQKHIRLQEARRLLIAGQADAASIGFSVGYESPSQFSREYARLFGMPPGRDAAQARSGSGRA